MKGGDTDKARVVRRLNRRRVRANTVVICASTSSILRVYKGRRAFSLRGLCHYYRVTERVAVGSR